MNTGRLSLDDKIVRSGEDTEFSNSDLRGHRNNVLSSSLFNST